MGNGNSAGNLRLDLARFETIPLPDLLAIQTISFRRFCLDWLDGEKPVPAGIKEVFAEFFPIVSNDGNFELHFDSYTILLPQKSQEECFQKDLTYSATVKGTFSFHNKKTGEIQEQSDVFITELPFMTREGTFIVNGVEKVVVSQLVRSPGIYFTRGEKRASHPDACFAKIIPSRGSWLKFEYDYKNKVYQVRIDSPRRVLKFPVTVFLKAFGFQVSSEGDRVVIKYKGEVIQSEHWKRQQIELKRELIQTTLEKDNTRDEWEANKEIWKKLFPTDPLPDKELIAILPNRYFDPKRYDLGRVGRFQINRRLGLNFPLERRTLTPADIIEAFYYLYRLQEFDDGETDDTDHLNLQNRRVETIGELLQGQFRKGLSRVERNVKERLVLQTAESEKPASLINPRPLVAAVKEFFGSSQMCQFMDNTNPLTSLTHKRRMSALGPKGLTREAARFDFRDVHFSHYGRICPVESPEGPNIGLISSLSTYARSNELGFIETPYFEVKDGKVTKTLVYLSAEEEKDAYIADATVELDKHNRIAEELLYARERGNFTRVKREQVGYVEVSPQQFISVTTSLIPFLEHDDANRALMGSNMQRQAVPLLFPEAPLVGTGNERKVAQDASAFVSSPVTGEISYVDSSRIEIEKAVVYDKESFEIIDLPNLETVREDEVLTESKFDYIFSLPTVKKDNLKDKEKKEEAPHLKFIAPDSQATRRLARRKKSVEKVYLRKFKRSNQGTLINQRSRVKPGTAVIRGDLLADSSSTDEGELALGRNVVVAFMPWRGYNFEDAVVISERLLKGDAYTSIHIEKFECEARQTKLGPEKITGELTALSEQYIKRNLDDRGIIRIGARVKAGDILVGKITPKGEGDLTGEEKLIRAVFGEKGKGYKETPLKLPFGQEGVVIETQYFSRLQGDQLSPNVSELARVFVAKKRNIKVGDKMAGRHGNKGVVAVILPEEDMPFLPDGTPVDVVLNPLGVPSRMNVGQLLENHVGLALSMIERDEIDEIRSHLKTAKPIKFSLSKVEKDLKVDKIFLKRAKSPLRLKSPVFDSITEDKIRILFDKLGLPLDGKSVLYDGLNGEPFKERVSVGVMYYMKLNHLVDDKMHARSTGSYALITQQPLGGKAQFGGQRLGEMEVWALEGYGAAYLLQEMLTVKSDDVPGRNQTYKAIVDGNLVPEPSIPESFNVITNELKSLCLDVTVEYETESKELIDIIREG